MTSTYDSEYTLAIQQNASQSDIPIWAPQDLADGELEKFRSRKQLDEQEWDRIAEDAAAILKKCINPANEEPHRTAGLAVGQIQSGKTLSMTALAALAADNKYRMIIILTGTALNLYNQNAERISNDLDLTSSMNKWFHHPRPATPNQYEPWAQDVISKLNSWDNHLYKPKTILVTVLKHSKHIENMASEMKKITTEGHYCPTLIIDDECDSYSLDGKAFQTGPDVTATYASIRDLRNAFPNHSYVGYTATPQAPILLDLASHLSPDFAHALNPGSGYMGPEEMFGPSSKICKTLDQSDIPTPENEIENVPESLRESLHLFVLASAILQIRASQGLINEVTPMTSMMITPSILTEQHDKYYNWVEDILNMWRDSLQDDDPTSSQATLIEKFRTHYEDLKQTETEWEYPPFDDEIKGNLHNVISQIKTNKIHKKANKTLLQDIKGFWNQSPHHILIGGQLLSRGFTMERIVTTYLCQKAAQRPTVDVISQRGRFFGYRKDIAPVTRIYCERTHAATFEDTIDHYKHIIESIKRFEESGEHFSKFKRRFLLDSAYRPTRPNVLTKSIIRGKFRENRWQHIVPIYGNSQDLIGRNDCNWALWEQFKKKHSSDFQHFDPDTNDPQRDHLSVSVSAQSLMEELLEEWKVLDQDEKLHEEALFQIVEYIAAHQDPNAYVIDMRPRIKDTYRSLREGTSTTTVSINPQAGRNPGTGGSAGHSADTNIRYPDEICVQIYRLDRLYGSSDLNVLLGKNVIGLSINLGKRMHGVQYQKESTN